ncbi:FixH family protein [Acuticoccus sp. M5D2P5]|uniref:FixH family protein n=1 Tax=Acuticoccus kalidii TaxID=2910977 RepID=UPI001F2C4CA0|nr:FixH family protein [Acuticoccus kalidii]MCF3934431.1 FixH family protein [Acuticoccus kalidii]
MSRQQAIRRFLLVKEFTGWHMLVILVLFFGTIITVNITMAIFATTSWTGLLAKNGYVASIDYAHDEAQREAAAALGWAVSMREENGLVTLAVADLEGLPLRAGVTAEVTRAVTGAESHPLHLAPEATGVFRSEVPLGNGRWIVTATITRDGQSVGWRSAFNVD